MNSLSALTPKLRAEIQQFISDEVSRQVEVRVRQEMTAYHAKQAAADHDFLNRPIKEQSMAIFLTRFAQESSQSAVDKDNLAILARAIAVSGSLPSPQLRSTFAPSMMMANPAHSQSSCWWRPSGRQTMLAPPEHV
jgi:hypothetical protein